MKKSASTQAAETGGLGLQPPAGETNARQSADRCGSQRMQHTRFDNSPPGFTIIEILVVLIIMSIVMVFAIGRGRVTGAEVKVQTEILKSQLRHAQARAMNDNNPWGIQTDSSGSTYWLFRYDGSFNQVRLPNEDALTVDLAAGGMTMTPGIYSFDPQGVPHFEANPSASQPSTAALPSPGQPITLSDGTDNYTILVTRNTGFIP